MPPSVVIASHLSPRSSSDDKAFDDYRTVAPNGSSESDAILNACSPKGIPMMVMQNRQPMPNQYSAVKMPPKGIQMMLPSKRMGTSIPPNEPVLNHMLPYGHMTT